MFENLLVNFKSKLNFSNNNNIYHEDEPDYSSYDSNHSGWSSVAHKFFQRFSTRNEDCKRYASIAQHHTNDEHGDAYFGRNGNRTAIVMFPRVSSGRGGTMEPIYLAPSEKNIDDIDNVVDKFIRVIHPRPVDNDVVHSMETERFQKVINSFICFILNIGLFFMLLNTCLLVIGKLPKNMKTGVGVLKPKPVYFLLYLGRNVKFLRKNCT